MDTLRLQYVKNDIEKKMIIAGMAIMELSGLVLLICGILNIKLV